MRNHKLLSLLTNICQQSQPIVCCLKVDIRFTSLYYDSNASSIYGVSNQYIMITRVCEGKFSSLLLVIVAIAILGGCAYIHACVRIGSGSVCKSGNLVNVCVRMCNICVGCTSFFYCKHIQALEHMYGCRKLFQLLCNLYAAAG